jgi:hypothetical protein
MNTLTLQQLQFIDHYLKNSGVEYVDIRTEMTDHVATALEKQDGDFYENFRLYMLGHKSELLKNNKHFKRLATKRAFKALGKMLIKPWFIALPFVLVYGCLYFAKTIGTEEMAYNLEITYMALFLISGISHLIYRQVAKKQFSVASQVVNIPMLVAYFLFNLLKPVRINSSALMSFIILSLLITIAFAIAVTSFSQTRKYKLTYSK